MVLFINLLGKLMEIEAPSDELLTMNMNLVTMRVHLAQFITKPNPSHKEPKSAPNSTIAISGTETGCSSLKPKACSSLPLEVVDHVNHFNTAKLNLHRNRGCYSKSNLQAQLDNDRASCNPPCFRITKPREYCCS